MKQQLPEAKEDRGEGLAQMAAPRPEPPTVWTTPTVILTTPDVVGGPCPQI